MPKVTFLPEGKSIEVAPGTTLLQAAKTAHAPVGYACGGVCACSTFFGSIATYEFSSSFASTSSTTPM